MKVIEKAKTSCENSGVVVADHFADISKMVTLGSDSTRELQDIALTRYACYLIAQNGDAQKAPWLISFLPSLLKQRTWPQKSPATM